MMQLEWDDDEAIALCWRGVRPEDRGDDEFVRWARWFGDALDEVGAAKKVGGR